jgi:hypothetical protein
VHLRAYGAAAQSRSPRDSRGANFRLSGPDSSGERVGVWLSGLRPNEVRCNTPAHQPTLLQFGSTLARRPMQTAARDNFNGLTQRFHDFPCENLRSRKVTTSRTPGNSLLPQSSDRRRRCRDNLIVIVALPVEKVASVYMLFSHFRDSDRDQALSKLACRAVPVRTVSVLPQPAQDDHSPVTSRRGFGSRSQTERESLRRHGNRAARHPGRAHLARS